MDIYVKKNNMARGKVGGATPETATDNGKLQQFQGAQISRESLFKNTTRKRGSAGCCLGNPQQKYMLPGKDQCIQTTKLKREDENLKAENYFPEKTNQLQLTINTN